LKKKQREIEMLERNEREIIKDGEIKKLVEIKEKQLPKELWWTEFVAKLKEKGYYLLFQYRTEKGLQEFEEPRMWVLDPKQGAPVPEVPRQIRVMKYESGKGFVTKAVIRNVNSIVDPDVDTSIKMFEMLI
jgi:hypothetical protein